jgi:Domain of unknown function (DUF4824)
MKKYGLISAIAVIILTNVVVLAGVAYNRSGEPDATVQLTERELHWENRWDWMDREDSGLHLILKWSRLGYDNFDRTRREDYWFNQQKLTEVGFDTSYPLDGKDADRYYRRQLPRQGYVVLEFDGDAYQNWLKKEKGRIEENRQKLLGEQESREKSNLENNIKRIEQSMITQSRLFAIDVGRDGPALRKQYPDQSKYIITSAVFAISRHYTSRKKDHPQPSQKYYFRGFIREISTPQIHVTSNFRSFFVSDIKTHTNIYLPKGKPLSDLEPRFQVTLNYGKRYEPWIADVKKLK